MGLDQYLYATKHIWKQEEQDTIQKALANAGLDVPGDPSQITFEVAYWRKANQIHRWFVDHVQGGNDNCEQYRVNETQLRELLNTCCTVLTQSDKAEELLPTQSGFFFGSTDYNEGYVHDLKYTIKRLRRILKEKQFFDEWFVSYRSSW